MSKLRSLVGWLVTAPFRLIFWIISLPFRFLAWLFRPITERFARAFKPIYDFLTEEPDDRPLMDAVADAAHNLESLWEHLEAFRTHLLRAVLALALASSLSFYFADQILDFLAQPIGGISVLRAIDLTENISAFMRVSILSGVALALPYIIFEVWLFVAPGISARSRRIGLMGIPVATLLFLAGMVFCYYLLLPTALPFMMNFMGIQTMPRPENYFKIVTLLLFWIGIAFEFPLVVYILTSMGFIQPRVLAANWRIAIVVIAIASAAITPTVDVGTMALVMVPMSLLYFISIGLSYLAAAGRRPKSEAQSPA
jgi:sec-independent protein translocase protein TatC